MWEMLHSCAKSGKRFSSAVARLCASQTMGITKYLACAALGLPWLMVSCVAPKATVVDQAPVKVKQEQAPVPAAPDLSVPAQVDDGLRMPDMLAMPSEGDFRSTSPSAVKSSNSSGAVIARPPVDASSQAKPKAE
jgi:hypothetical protein